MKFLGIWLLSFFAWLAIACVEGYLKEASGYTHDEAATEGARTLKVGMLITGIGLLGVWCIWFS